MPTSTSTPVANKFSKEPSKKLELPNKQQLQLLATLGEAEFNDHLLKWFKKSLAADQCMLFFYSNKQQLSSLLFKDFSNQASGKNLANAYISEGYLTDPHFKIFTSCLPEQLEVFTLATRQEKMTASYKERFFTQPGFQDKLAILFASDVGNFYLNLYSRTHSYDQVFNQQQLKQLAQFLALLISRHYQLNLAQLKQGPLAFLSAREQEVCNKILQGKKNEKIAYELKLATSSVATYRRRAYIKLGINSAAQLFALCQT